MIVVHYRLTEDSRLGEAWMELGPHSPVMLGSRNLFNLTEPSSPRNSNLYVAPRLKLIGLMAPSLGASQYALAAEQGVHDQVTVSLPVSQLRSNARQSDSPVQEHLAKTCSRQRQALIST